MRVPAGNIAFKMWHSFRYSVRNNGKKSKFLSWRNLRVDFKKENAFCIAV
jgi:hypothetical protein